MFQVVALRLLFAVILSAGLGLLPRLIWAEAVILKVPNWLAR